MKISFFIVIVESIESIFGLRLQGHGYSSAKTKHKYMCYIIYVQEKITDT